MQFPITISVIFPEEDSSIVQRKEIQHKFTSFSKNNVVLFEKNC